MAKIVEVIENEFHSNDNSISIKEFLQIEKTCDEYKDPDDEIKSIFNEIKKLSPVESNNNILPEDLDDVDLIMKKAEDIAQETHKILQGKTHCSGNVALVKETLQSIFPSKVPLIKVTKAFERDNDEGVGHKNIAKNSTKKANKETSFQKKTKARPFSAGIADVKKTIIDNKARSQNSTPKKVLCKHESILEEMKDTNERARHLELLNVKLTEDNKGMKKKIHELEENCHIAELKLNECEKFLNKIGNEYENKSLQLKEVKESEIRTFAELNKERTERKNLKIQHEKDLVVIQDLQRQCREMELILKRKHPDSVSALIVASKSSTVDDNKKKLLEDRLSRLEQELKDKDTHFQNVLMTLQEKFTDMKQKYENHIIDVERQLMDERRHITELKNSMNHVNRGDMATQTWKVGLHTVATQTFVKSIDRAQSAVVSRMSHSSSLIMNKLKEDSYLVATIKGLQAELTVKQRTISKINRETEELKKNLRNLQKEKDVLLNLTPAKKTIYKQAKSAENILTRMNNEMESELIEARRQKDAVLKERNDILDSLKHSNEELIVLKKRRIQDLHTLQLAHEKELMQMNMQIYPLQEEIKLLNRTVEILQERVRGSEEKLMRFQAGLKDIDYKAGGDNNSNRNFRKDMRSYRES